MDLFNLYKLEVHFLKSVHICLVLCYRKDNVLRLWNYLLELLRTRRMRLELTLNLQKIFQEMLYILDWMEEIKVAVIVRN